MCVCFRQTNYNRGKKINWEVFLTSSIWEFRVLSLRESGLELPCAFFTCHETFRWAGEVQTGLPGVPNGALHPKCFLTLILLTLKALQHTPCSLSLSLSSLGRPPGLSGNSDMSCVRLYPAFLPHPLTIIQPLWLSPEGKEGRNTMFSLTCSCRPHFILCIR